MLWDLMPLPRLRKINTECGWHAYMEGKTKAPPPSGEGFLTKGNPPMLRWLVRGILFLSFDARIVKMVNTRSGINRYGIANLGVHGRS